MLDWLTTHPTELQLIGVACIVIAVMWVLALAPIGSPAYPDQDEKAKRDSTAPDQQG